MSKRLVLPAKLPDFGIPLGDRQRRRLEKLGEFPKRIPLSGRSHAYAEDEILAFIDRKIAARDEVAA